MVKKILISFVAALTTSVGAMAFTNESEGGASNIVTYTVNGVNFDMVNVEGGSFKMGANSDTGFDGNLEDAKPVHKVTVSDFSIGKTEVTQALWKAVMGENNNPSHFKKDNFPVENVSWADCKRFIRKLNAATGENFRLPTEAEWEFACRGGNSSNHYKYSGGNNLDDVAWYKDNSGNRTHAAVTKQPNELGIYGMSGNVWEWCEDVYGPYGEASQHNPLVLGDSNNHVFRGGSWYHSDWRCDPAFRGQDASTATYDRGGFRLAKGDTDYTVVFLPVAASPAPSTPSASGSGMNYESNSERKPPIIDFVLGSLKMVDGNGNGKIDAKETCYLQFKVHNRGMGPAMNCKAIVKVDGVTDGMSYREKTPIETIDVGTSTTVSIPITTDINTAEGNVTFSVKVEEPQGFGTDFLSLAVPVHAYEAPDVQVLAYSITSNQGSTLEKKIPFDFQVVIKNAGKDAAENVKVDIRVPQNVLLLTEDDASMTIGTIDVGDFKSHVYSFTANNNFSGTEIPSLSIFARNTADMLTAKPSG